MRGAPSCRSPPRCTFRALAPAGGTKPTRRSLSGPTAGTTSKPEPRTGGKQWKLWWRKRLDRRRIDLADRRPRKRAKADARTLAYAAVLAASDPNVVAVVVVTYTQSREAVIGEHTDPDHPGAGHKDAPERICSDPTASAHEGCSPNTRASAQPRTRDPRTLQIVREGRQGRRVDPLGRRVRPEDTPDQRTRMVEREGKPRDREVGGERRIGGALRRRCPGRAIDADDRGRRRHGSGSSRKRSNGPGPATNEAQARHPTTTRSVPAHHRYGAPRCDGAGALRGRDREVEPRPDRPADRPAADPRRAPRGRRPEPEPARPRGPEGLQAGPTGTAPPGRRPGPVQRPPVGPKRRQGGPVEAPPPKVRPGPDRPVPEWAHGQVRRPARRACRWDRPGPKQGPPGRSDHASKTAATAPRRTPPGAHLQTDRRSPRRRLHRATGRHRRRPGSPGRARPTARPRPARRPGPGRAGRREPGGTRRPPGGSAPHRPPADETGTRAASPGGPPTDRRARRNARRAARNEAEAHRSGRRDRHAGRAADDGAREPRQAPGRDADGRRRTLRWTHSMELGKRPPCAGSLRAGGRECNTQPTATTEIPGTRRTAIRNARETTGSSEAQPGPGDRKAAADTRTPTAGSPNDSRPTTRERNRATVADAAARCATPNDRHAPMSRSQSSHGTRTSSPTKDRIERQAATTCGDPPLDESASSSDADRPPKPAAEPSLNAACGQHGASHHGLTKHRRSNTLEQPG